MTDASRHYRRLEQLLWMTRWLHEGQESSEEDAILDEMDEVWDGLDEDERRLLDEEGARCWPLEANGWVPTLAEAVRIMTPEQPAYGGFASVEHTIEGFEPAGGT
ncbi:MAG: hypothetical protein ACREA0_09380 [bacterium]